MAPSRVACCIQGCSNSPYRNIEGDTKVKFYRFPVSTLNVVHITFKRNQWINAVKNHVKNPKNWEPTTNTRICSAHFIDNKKSENPSHPSYLPRIFPGQNNLKKHTQSLQRFQRLQQRREKTTASNKELISHNSNSNNNSTDNICKTEMEQRDESSISIEAQLHAKVNDSNIVSKVTCRSITCQTEDVIDNFSSDPPYFLCNLSHSNGVSVAEVQVNISKGKTLDKVCEVDLQPARKTLKDIGCDTIDHDSSNSNPPCHSYNGMTSIINNDSSSSLTGVPPVDFHFILKMLPDCEIVQVDKKAKLLITLMKLKTDLTFTALSAFFKINRATVQQIFVNNLQQLKILLKNFLFWPPQATVQANLPGAFNQNPTKTRVIIDCIEVNTEVSAEVKKKILVDSDYKHQNTVKFMVGFCPNEFISFVSKGYEGHASDSFITNDCGIMDLIVPGDVVLANKSFPQMKNGVEKKNAVFIGPPFSCDTQFTSQEIEGTYNIASVRMHIERVKERIKDFNILKKVPVSLIPHIDGIVFVVCALVNMNNPIMKQMNNTHLCWNESGKQ